MEALRKRYDDLKLAEDSRDRVVTDLFEMSNEMNMKVERNSFVVALIDGDHMKVRLPSCLQLKTFFASHELEPR